MQSGKDFVTTLNYSHILLSLTDNHENTLLTFDSYVYLLNLGINVVYFKYNLTNIILLEH